jgi:polysaccharide export outer membrane protein
MSKRLALTWMLPLLLLGSARTAGAEDYVIGPDDVLSVSVYLHPELERTATVNAQGNITFPPIGDVKAGGLTAKQLGDRLSDRLSTYLRSTTAVTVTISQFMSRSVFISGAVNKPGRYGFEVIPGVIDVIAQAGGAVVGADLSRVEIVRREGDNRRTLYADVGAALRDGVGVPLPELKAGDSINVPIVQGIQGTGVGAPGVGVLGEVLRPGLYPVNANTDLWTVLAIAGGLTRQGDLGNVRVISSAGGAQTVARVNLKEVLAKGARGPHLLKAGDVVFIPMSTAASIGRAGTALMSLSQVAVDLVNVYVVADAIKSE